MDRRGEVSARLAGGKLVAVLRTSVPDEAVWLGECLLELGWPAIEVTWTIPDPARVLHHLADRALEGTTLVGAGTILNRHDALEAIAAGARYLVSPARPAGLADLAHHHDLPVVLGALTPHEIHEAIEAGADFVKIFPIHRLGGAGYLRDVRAPFPDLRAFASGGIEPGEAGAYLQAGATVISLGQTLAHGDTIRSRKADRVAACVATARASLA
ncbi:MAG: 2-dehydro-3-deoxyphosphogluconate aldolase [Candidatus Sericytochromatia bacterium]|nr:2-dehydro-3-deoxyphosphogluconate aldolase [Candidatus Tanganyikabacteria bacterium]